jgi:hypothetical protein
MTLHDQVIDEAQEAGMRRVLGADYTNADIVELVSEIVGIKLDHDGTYARLAIAAYVRQEAISAMLEDALLTEGVR